MNMSPIIIIPAVVWIVWRVFAIINLWSVTPITSSGMLPDFTYMSQVATWYVVKWQIAPAVALIILTLILTKNSQNEA